MNRWILPLVAVLGAIGGAALVWGVDRATPVAIGDRARIEGVVRDYVLTHPELIPEAMQKLQERESGKQVAAAGDAITRPFAGAWAGNPKGDVTVVEYFDYNCGYCRAILPTVATLLERDPNIRIVYRDLPILAPTSRTAARASLAAAVQNRFPAFHDALYAAGPVSDASIAAAARATGVSLAKLDTARLDEEIARNMETAGRLGLSGTPAWVIGDRVLSGALPIEELEKAIAAARKG